MKKVEKIVKTYYEVDLNCSNRRMYEIRDNIYDICWELDNTDELYGSLVLSKCDYEDDLEVIILNYDYLDELHIAVWKQICDKYEIECISDIPNRIHLVC